MVDPRPSPRRSLGIASAVAATCAGLALAGLLPVGAGGAATGELRTANAAAADVQLLFVQNARGGRLSPLAGKPGRYRLSLRGVDPHTVYFSDRPQRLTGVAGTGQVLDGLFGRGAPPNAVVELTGGAEATDTVAVELSKPRYRPRKRTLTYTARGLHESDLDHPRLAASRERLDDRLPPRFGPVSLFIDDSDWGNTCTVNLTNSAQGSMWVTSSSKWSTDHWDGDPSNLSWKPGGQTKGWKSGGGFDRGCSNTVTIHTWDGATIQIVTTDPWSGGNTHDCTVTPAPNGYGPYKCEMGPGSTTGGPVILINWNVTQVAGS